MKLFKLALVAASVAFAGSAIAAVDGTLGATSTGTTDVTIVKQDAVEITNMNDIDFGTVGVMANASETESDDVCVFSTTGTYSVTATSANGGFTLDGAAGNLTNIPYALEWTVGTVVSDLDAGPVAATGDATSRTCSGGTNATVSVTVQKTDFDAAEVDSYSDTVTLVVSPT